MRETMDGLYELFIVRNPKLKLYQGVFNTFPDIKEWSMKDLYSRHPDPSKPFLYMYRCRKDDVIVLSNGEKIAPALMEATLMSHPLVKGAMVVGQGKFQPAALLDLFCEVPRDSTARYQLLESLRSTIAEANTHAPAHGKLDQYHILFADPSKPINYLGQGKIQRKSTLHLYEKDFEELYKTADEAVEQLEFSNLPALKPHSLESVALWLERLIKEIINSEPLQRDTDFFTAGLDSLQVIQMARELRFQARKLGMGDRSAEMFPPASIYTHPTVDRLAAHILHKLRVTPSSNDISIQPNGHHSDESPSIEEMHRLFQKYSESLPRSSALRPLPPSKNKIVLLTGSTGSLGSYLLNELQNDRDVSRIICLNRSADAAFRQAQLSFQRGLNTTDSNRVEFLQGDLSKPYFGLQSETYSRLLQSVSHMIRPYSLRTIS
jgi:aryl carrier-like protein